MRKAAVLLFTRNFLQISFFLFCFSSAAYSQCPVTVAVNINDQGSKITVKPGAGLKMKFAYTISNPSGWDEDRFNQVLVGLNTNYLECIYTGVPKVCPLTSTDSYQKTYTAPTMPGTYTVYYSTSRESNCNPYAYRANTSIGTIIVQDELQCNNTVSLDMNASGNNITLAAGASVAMSYNLSLANLASCSNCNNQVLVGLNDKFLDCIYSGVPAACPSASASSFKKTITAPTTPGTYTVYYNTVQDTGCNPAAYKARTVIGSITVQQQEQKCNSTVSLKMTAAGVLGDKITVAPGAQVSMNYNYNISNPSTCSDCNAQILVGLNDKYLECIYNAISAVCPLASSGSYQKNIIAPAVPGTYTIYYSTAQDGVCTPTSYKAENIIGTITVQQPEQICNTVVGLDMNSSGNKVIVIPGAEVNMNFNYSIANAKNCENCKEQIMVGMDSVFLHCIYDSIAPLCPIVSTGTFQKTIVAPASPGTYTVYYGTARDSSCNPAAYKASNIIGTIIVQPEKKCSTAVVLDMNSAGNKITVAPGAQVSMNFKYDISNPAGCDNCKNQIMVGLDTYYLDCIYNAVSDVCPAVSSGSFQKTINAPLTPGTYGIFYSTAQKYFCVPTTYKAKEFVGSITVVSN